MFLQRNTKQIPEKGFSYDDRLFHVIFVRWSLLLGFLW